MNKLKQLREKRAEAQKKLNDIIAAADKEVRAMNEQEVADFEKYEKEIKDIDATIEAAERARKITERADEDEDNDDKDVEKRAEDVEKAEERAFANYIRGEVEERSSVTLNKTDNGAIIPSTIANKIIDKVKNISPIFQDAEHYNIGGTLSLPYYDESAGTIEMQYTEEGEDGESTSGKYKSIQLNGFLARAITEVSKSLINNSQFDVTSHVITKMAQSIAVFIEKELLIGTAGKIEGLSTLTNKVVAASSTAITADELIDLQEAVHDVYQAGAYWIMSKDTRKSIRKLKDGQGNYLLNRDATARWGYTLLGKDVYVSDAMPDMAAGKRAIIYGDMKGLAVKLSENINIEVLRETKARLHMLEIIGFVELDAKVQNTQMLAALDMKSA